MKKIVIVTDVWAKKNVSGVVTSLLYTKKWLKKKGFNVSVIHPGYFFSFPLPSYKEIRLAFFTKKKLEKMIKQKNPDYIHIETEGPLGFAARQICTKNKLKFTTSYHTRLPDYISIRMKPIKKPIKRATYNYLRWFHSESQKMSVSTITLKKELEEMNFKNVISFPLGVDLELFKRNPKAKVPKKFKKPIFVFLGRVAPEKNIQAFLKCDLPGTKLIIGDGPHKKRLEKKFKKDTIFTGVKKGKKLIDLLSVCDVFVFPSKTDTFGLVLIEALACGLPVAAYNVQGPKNIITNGVDGYLGKNLELNAKKCLKLNPKDCRKTALKFSWENFINEFIKHLVHV